MVPDHGGQFFLKISKNQQGRKEGCQNNLFQQKLLHNTALCVRQYVYEVNLSTFLEHATQIHGGTSDNLR